MTAEPNKASPSTAEDPFTVSQEIAAALDEPKPWLVRRVVYTIGIARTRAFLQQTLDAEAQGGMMTVDGQRRRTPGGVFFHLVKGGVSQKEKHAIFSRTQRKTKKPAQGQSSDQPQDKAEPLSWAEGQATIVKLIQEAKGEATTVKLTLIGRPKKVAKAKSCMVAILEGREPPQHLPKGLPRPPQAKQNFAVFMVEKHWRKVAESLQEHQDDELIIEGYPVIDAKQQVTVVLAQGVTTKMMQQAKRKPMQESAG